MTGASSAGALVPRPATTTYAQPAGPPPPQQQQHQPVHDGIYLFFEKTIFG